MGDRLTPGDDAATWKISEAALYPLLAVMYLVVSKLLQSKLGGDGEGMKKFKNVTVPAKTERCQAAIICDLCRKKSPQPKDWGENRFQISETSVSLSEGSSYPDNGNKIVTYIDICPECFKTKLMPWLESQGVKPTIEEIDW